MSKLDFPLEEFKSRQQRVRHAMEEAGLDLLLIIHPTNIFYLTGLRGGGGESEFQLFFFPLDPNEKLSLVCRLSDVAEHRKLTLMEDVRGWGGREPEDPIDIVNALMKEKGYFNRRIGLEVPPYYLDPHHYVQLKEMLGDALVTEATHLIEDLRLVKTPAEIECYREAAGVAEAAMKTCVEHVEIGKTQQDVAAEMQYTMWLHGTEVPARPLYFGSGDRSVYTCWMPSDIKAVQPNSGLFQKGDSGHIDFAAAVKRYCAPMGRVFSFGEPSIRNKEIYQVVREASDAAIEAIKPGVSATVPHQAAKAVIQKAGLDKYRVHMTGYSVAPGFPPSWIESLHLDADSPYTLEAGMVLAVQPPVLNYDEGIGARITDTLLVTKSGTEFLTRFDRDVIVV